MKVYINRYRDHWLSPYTIMEKALFWREMPDYDTPWVERVNKALEPLCKGLQSFLNFIHPKINYVKIDKWDTWSMDNTLAFIIVPMLKQLRATTHGAPYVKDEDVPEGEGLRSTEAPPVTDEGSIDENHFKRWDWVLDEMIYAFSSKTSDESFMDRFRTGEVDIQWEVCAYDDLGNPSMHRMVDGPNHTVEYDWEGIRKEEARIANGFRLFGVYYQGLWD